MMNSRHVLSLLVLLPFFACESHVTNPEAGSQADSPLLKRGGGGKPGGGGGGGGPADPVIAFRNNGQLRVMNVDGSNSTVVIAEFGSGSAWSPRGDGSAANPYQIVYEYGDGLLATVEITTPAEGGVVSTTPTTIGATTVFLSARSPDWSPDGGRIAFTANLGVICANGEGQGESDLFTMNTNGSDLIRHTHNCDNYIFANDPSWSPDGSAIAFRETLAREPWTSAVKILHLDDGSIETVFDADALPDVSSVRHRPDWGRVDTNPKLLINAVRMKAKRKRSEPVFAVYTLNLQKDDTSGHYSAPDPPVWKVDGRRPSWSPDDTRFVMDGVTIYDVATGQTTRLANGDMAEWRR